MTAFAKQVAEDISTPKVDLGQYLPGATSIFSWAYNACKAACQAKNITEVGEDYFEDCARDLISKIGTLHPSTPEEVLEITQDWANILDNDDDDDKNIGRWLLDGLIPESVDDAPHFPDTAPPPPT